MKVFNDESMQIIAAEVDRIKKSQPKLKIKRAQDNMDFASTADATLQILIASIGDQQQLEEAIKSIVSKLDPMTADKAIRETMAEMFPEEV